MDETENKRIQEKIESLPKGSIYVKRINGKEYEYWQYRENGRQVSKRVKGEELDILRVQIEERKRLEQLLKDNDFHGQPVTASSADMSGFHSLVRLGDDLNRFVRPVKNFMTREIYQQLHDYIHGAGNDRVFILYGLRRTGKTTMFFRVRILSASCLPKMNSFMTAASCCIQHSFHTGSLSAFLESMELISISAMAEP